MDIWNLHEQGNQPLPLLNHEGKPLKALIIERLSPNENWGSDGENYVVKIIPYHWSEAKGCYQDVFKNVLLVREARDIDIGASIKANAEEEYGEKAPNTDTLTLEKIKNWVESIRQLADEGDYENAHYSEDGLFQKFIAHVAANATDPSLAEMAKEVLKSNEIGFSHWYA